jgi:hypothetical protein
MGMSTGSGEVHIRPTRDGIAIPASELLTGRGFITGKSGSGKSNTTSVLIEELLDEGFTLLVIDTEGEYYGLKEEYELLHVGGDDFADVIVGIEHADTVAETALEDNVPVILDVSGYDDADEAEGLVKAVLTDLFRREKSVRKPFLVVIEEMQEYLPQRGGGGELGTLLTRIAKRGRKRGLGVCGISQRPSSVDKDFITQCDWMVWHRLNWENDLDVVRNVMGAARANAIEEFAPGEGFLMTDWDDTVRQVRFRRKRTHDAGATPGLDRYDDVGKSRGSAAAVDELAAAGADVLDSPSEPPGDEVGTDLPDGDPATDLGAQAEVAAQEGDSPAVQPTDAESLDPDGHEGTGTAVTGTAVEQPSAPPASVEPATGTQDGGDPPARAGSHPTPSAVGPARPERPTLPSSPDTGGLRGLALEFGGLSAYCWRWVVYALRLLRYHAVRVLATHT